MIGVEATANRAALLAGEPVAREYLLPPFPFLRAPVLGAVAKVRRARFAATLRGKLVRLDTTA